MKRVGLWIAAAMLASSLPAQQVKWNFDRLAAKAANSVDVTLDGSTLRLATKFLSGEDEDEAKVKKLVAGLKGIYVKSFEFKNAGEYTQADLEGFRALVRTPGWERIVGVQSKEDGENVEIYLKTDPKGIGGLAIIAAEPKELTLVNIVGPIDLDSLSELGGHFGIPEVDVEKKK
ncbi:MAG: DUF4252 domain-containing protein [Bryobacteraceae bacterium]